MVTIPRTIAVQTEEMYRVQSTCLPVAQIRQRRRNRGQSMVIFITGASHTGKTKLAQQFFEERYWKDYRIDFSVPELEEEDDHEQHH